MSLIHFPGLIDVHVHLRDPGATHKEDLATGSIAALAGGFTYILDMPNNPTPTITLDRLEEKILLSKQKAKCDIGFHFGTDGNNTDTFAEAAKNPHVFGLKIYCNHTTGTLLIEDKEKLDNIFSAWNFEKPILVHAEQMQLEHTIFLAEKYKRRLHVCHIALASEVEMVQKAKEKGLSISAGVTPHHLFLTVEDTKTPPNLPFVKGEERRGSFMTMKPLLGNQQDQDALWKGLLDGTIDLVESDHAPHTLQEKSGEKPMFGVPELETTLGLLLKSVHNKKIALEQVKQFLYDRPKNIFHIPDQKDTYIEFEPEKPYILKKENLKTKCGWSPFENWELYGKVEKVTFSTISYTTENNNISETIIKRRKTKLNVS